MLIAKNLHSQGRIMKFLNPNFIQIDSEGSKLYITGLFSLLNEKTRIIFDVEKDFDGACFLPAEVKYNNYPMNSCSDVYSIGVICLILCFGDYYQEGLYHILICETELIEKFKCTAFSQELSQIIIHCVLNYPADRWGVDKVLKEIETHYSKHSF